MDNVLSGRVPPSSIEAEQSVLGAMLVDDEIIPSVLGIVKSEDFYRNDHKLIYEAINRLFNEAANIDIVTVSDMLKSNGQLEKAGGLEYLSLLPSLVPSSTNAEAYAKIVEEKAILRNLIKAASSVVEKGFEGEDEASTVLDYAEDKIFDVLAKRENKGFTHIKDVLVDSVHKIEELYKNQGSITGIPTGFHELDRILSGLHNSDLILLAARPAMGKTALALNIAQQAAIAGRASTAIFSLEMSKEQLVSRMLASQSLIESNKLRDGSLNSEDWSKLASGLGPLSSANVYIDDTAGISVTQMRAKCRKLKLEGKLDLIVLDYLQLMEGPAKETRQNQISAISRSLKILAKELNVPIICLSQLSRGPESRTDKRPMLSDLRESGAIEQDADIVMFIYRDDYYNQDSEEKNVAEVIIAKHRNGEVGTVKLGWIGKYTKFVNMDRTHE